MTPSKRKSLPTAEHKRRIPATDAQRPPVPGELETMTERRAKALTLRKAGLSYRRVAAECGVSVETAWSDVQAELGALRKLTEQQAEDVRELELRRLDDWTLGLTPKARAGDAKSVMALVRCQERRAKLLGLDAPVVTEHLIAPLVIDELDHPKRVN